MIHFVSIAACYTFVFVPTTVVMGMSLQPSTTPSFSSKQILKIRIGTRPSPLAKVQTQAVAEALKQEWAGSGLLDIHADGDGDGDIDVQIEIVEITTTDDQPTSKASTQNTPLAVRSIDWTGALDQALLNDEIDAAVHSLKDIPPSSRWCEGLEIACCLKREDPTDVLVVYKGMSTDSNVNVNVNINGALCVENLPKGARVGTSSVRRQAQLLSIRDDLKLINLRGNVEARLDSLRRGEVDALIVASAGLKRLLASDDDDDDNCNGVCDMDLDWGSISSGEMLSGACQGIIGVTVRSSLDDDSCSDCGDHFSISTFDLLSRINNVDANLAATAERSFLNVLDSFRPRTHEETSREWKGRPPLAALFAKSESQSDGGATDIWKFEGLLARPDGSKVLRSATTTKHAVSKDDARKIGEACALDLLGQAGHNFYIETN